MEMNMRARVCSMLIGVCIVTAIPQPVMAQNVIDDAVKVVDGLINVFGKKKKANQTKTNNQQKSTVVQQGSQKTVSSQEGIKKDCWVEAIYPGGGWLLPMDEEKGITQIRLYVNRYNIPATIPDHYKGWGEIELADINVDEEGLLGAPTQIGDVYYFGITTKSGSSRIGIKKLRDNPDDNPYLKIVEVSGAIAKWVKQGSKLFISQGNGRLYNPTVLAMNEKELDEILKRCNNDNYIDYNWWVKNRTNLYTSNSASAAKTSGKLNSEAYDEKDTIPEVHDEVSNQPLQRTATTAVSNSTALGELGIFELRGPVRKCVWKNSNETSTHEFDRKGLWILKNGQKPWAGQESVKRDRQGRIIKMGDSYDEEYVAFTYNTNGLVIKEIKKYMDGMFQTNYFYNSKGECTKTILEYDDMGETGKETTTYTIMLRDSRGNWIKRKTQKGAIETRTITYY